MPHKPKRHHRQISRCCKPVNLRPGRMNSRKRSKICRLQMNTRYPHCNIQIPYCTFRLGYRHQMRYCSRLRCLSHGQLPWNSQLRSSNPFLQRRRILMHSFHFRLLQMRSPLPCSCSGQSTLNSYRHMHRSYQIPRNIRKTVRSYQMRWIGLPHAHSARRQTNIH